MHENPFAVLENCEEASGVDTRVSSDLVAAQRGHECMTCVGCASKDSE